MGGNKPNEMKKEERKMEPSSESLNFERRRHRRFSVALPIEYWQMDKSRSRPGQTINISEGGLLLQLSEPLEIGQVLGLTLFITSGPDLDAIEAVAQVGVVWQDSYAGKDGAYRVGVNFVDFSPEDTVKLKNLLDALKNAPCREGNPEP
jgi:c-di-GMP-binding flagellar brake protein YcgR